MVQAIDRLRLIHSPRKKTVCILCNIPLGIPIDALVTWQQLAGDGRLAQALQECEENGWEALPLAATELTCLFPEIWETEKAAEGWLGNNPLNPLISIIRLWGVIHLYRFSGRRGRWSRALVRHGADPRMALAAVLGLAADGIRVRESAGPAAPATASAIPTVHPTKDPSPNPNTGSAADPSTGVPSSPAGDR
jgi:hypothetical protein